MGSGNSCNQGLLACDPLPIPTFSYSENSISFLILLLPREADMCLYQKNKY